MRMKYCFIIMTLSVPLSFIIIYWCIQLELFQGVYMMILKNFQRHYQTSRAPFGLFYHPAWSVLNKMEPPQLQQISNLQRHKFVFLQGNCFTYAVGWMTVNICKFLLYSVTKAGVDFLQLVFSHSLCQRKLQWPKFWVALLLISL